MRRDAAPSYAYRATGARAAKPGTVAPIGAEHPIGGVEAAPEDEAASASPPPSIDGKGTLINTYA